MATKKKILVVEDNRPLGKAMKIQLEKAGFEVAQAYDGKEAILKAKQLNPDIITLDLLMPELDGFEVLKLLKLNKETEQIPVIILTTYDIK